MLPSGVVTGTTCSVLGTNNFEFYSNISIYPNPFTNVFSVNSNARGSIEDYDVMGKIIKTKKLDLGIAKLDLSNSPSGIYLMKVTNVNDQIKTVKLIKH